MAKPAAKPDKPKTKQVRTDGRIVGNRELIAATDMAKARHAMYLRLQEQMSWAEIAASKWPLDDMGVPMPGAKPMFSSGNHAQRVVRHFIEELREDHKDAAADIVNAHYRHLWKLCSIRFEQDGSATALEGMFAALERMERFWTGTAFAQGGNGGFSALPQGGPGGGTQAAAMVQVNVEAPAPAPNAGLLTNPGGVTGLSALKRRQDEARQREATTIEATAIDKGQPPSAP